MPLLTIGSTGPQVRELQAKLNMRPPSVLPPLVVDGIFGPKTLARVKEFQSLNGLRPDGIAGPKTMEKLSGGSPNTYPKQTGTRCGVVDSANMNAWVSQRQFAGTRNVAVGGPDVSVLPGIRPLTDDQKAKARAVYGESLDFSRIYVSAQTGLGDRPFTVAVRLSAGIVQIINCGTFTPSGPLLIHELAHVWQSQHHHDPFAFMTNATGSQAKALAANGAEVVRDPWVISHSEFPVQFPFSAYAYFPHQAVTELAAEQMAQAIEKGESRIVAHVRSIGMNAVDAVNVMALAAFRTGDRRSPGIQI